MLLGYEIPSQCEVFAYFNFLILPPGKDNFCLILVSLLYVLGVVGEQVILHSSCLNIYTRHAIFYYSTFSFMVLEAKIDSIFLKFNQLFFFSWGCVWLLSVTLLVRGLNSLFLVALRKLSLHNTVSGS